MSSYRIPAKPTTYAGTRFRSRLEARWAAFFDLAGWRWEYEPSDDGDWTPDFILRGADGPVAVEVKPIEWAAGGGVPPWSDPAFERADLAKVHNSDRGERLVLGAYLPSYDRDASMRCLGVFVDEGFAGLDSALLWKGYGTELDFAAAMGSFHYRIGGQHDGDHHLRPVDPDVVDKMWRQAGNLTQWRGR